MKLIKFIFTFLLLFTISACNNSENESPEQIIPVDLGGKETFENMTYINVELFDSIDIRTLDNDNYQVEVKKSIFDLDKIKSSSITIYTQNISESGSGFSNGDNFKSVHFNNILMEEYVMNGFPEACEFLNEEFLNDIINLEKNEIAANYIYDKYGTDFTISCYTRYNNKIEVTVEALDESYDKYKREFIEYLFNQSPTLEEKTKYEAMYKCFNIKYSSKGYIPINSREDFELRLSNLIYGEFSFLDSITHLYEALPDIYPNAKEKLKTLYDEFQV